MKFDILIGSDNFWNALEADILSAQNRVHIQAMTFEGDSVGLKAFEAMKQSNAADKHLCVDHFSNLVISDDFIYGRRRLRDAEFRQEVRATREMFRSAPSENIQLAFTNPMGFLFSKYPHRNHKKLMLIDDHIAYVGGINFSEHNFEWHDIMLRIENPDMAELLGEDYQHTVNGRNQSLRTQVGDADVFILDGRRSWGLYEDLFDVLKSAKHSIKVISPYITWPFLDVIGEKAKQGVDVQIISPESNNKSLLKYYLQHQQQKYPFSIFMYEKKMSHLKAILIDDEILVMGSTNFDFASYCLEQEFCFVLRNPDLIEQFKEKVVDDAMAHSRAHLPETTNWKHNAAGAVISIAISGCKGLSKIIYRGR
ncbi:MAG: phosphatidylserine/phosphatidylglycerophosphate/cardiolipin synthase family protein [Acidimicrobiales bacterium]|nr:phosphatidylserine/phosphatidylglycerophosphate/cardiolipin synthase family protein [Hyphomonadaceae bacterium]RZV37281.1 MAG: phosphatidylserine/phosphatidylglycerophosphate/cardiolipin synthase family protein [Acidimicrobiales bacterium]